MRRKDKQGSDIANKIKYKYQKDMPKDQAIALYESVEWSSAKKPDLLLKALKNSHTVVTAWDGERLVGLGNAILMVILLCTIPIWLYILSIRVKVSGQRL